mmetsp:Transcript_75744/g.173314  ORF Transcript_75744/g.173314 Transcript_75744/m.173314 type:complete len:106 (+) Transcript_75744:1481-1798(+)
MAVKDRGGQCTHGATATGLEVALEIGEEVLNLDMPDGAFCLHHILRFVGGILQCPDTKVRDPSCNVCSEDARDGAAESRSKRQRLSDSRGCPVVCNDCARVINSQ